jgi:retron-type reverse transcriptase
MVKNALEPSWEARFEGRSYGFRPGRSCHDAIEKIYGLARPNKTKKWILDADIRGAFDHSSHAYLVKAIGPVPGKERDLRNGSKQDMWNRERFMQRSKEPRRVESPHLCWPISRCRGWKRPWGSPMTPEANSSANGQS